MRFLTALLALALLAAPASAQVVERPVPFDSAGRVMVLTPIAVARMELLPPVWQITGDFSEARLFETGPDAYVLVVTRPSGAVERYPMSAADVAYLRARAAAVPPVFAEEIRTAKGVRRDFIRNQTIIGATIYAPAFAAAVTNDEAGGLATYLLLTGASYFGAAALTREIEITGPMNSLATHMAIRGGAMGYGLTYAADASGDGKAAGIFAGSLLGTATGLWIGKGLTSGEARAMGFGADASALLALGLLHLDRDVWEDGPDERSHAATLVGAGAGGYALGLVWARNAAYNITSGDITALWVSGLIGALTTATLATAADLEDHQYVPIMTGGMALGFVVGDRLLVRRYDHTVAEGSLLMVGAVAGGLMGMGVGVLIDRENETLLMSLASAGAVGGMFATERLFPPAGDAGRSASRIQWNPAGVALAAAGVPGRFPVVAIRF